MIRLNVDSDCEFTRGHRIARPQDTENLYILSLTKKMGQEQSKQSTSKKSLNEVQPK